MSGNTLLYGTLRITKGDTHRITKGNTNSFAKKDTRRISKGNNIGSQKVILIE